MSLIKKLTMYCARCQTEHEKLGYFNSESNSLWDNYFLCSQCFKKAFNQLTKKQKGEWWFYGNKTENTGNTERVC